MDIAPKYQAEIARLKRRLRSGDHVSIGNIPVAYRAASDRRRAFKWWRRAASTGDGDALLEVAYCLHYGVGVRRDIAAAASAYRAAIRSRAITEYGREEARYHLAVSHLDARSDARARSRAVALLRQAAADGDYPRAAALLSRIESGVEYAVCRCRRGLRPSHGGRAQCSLHGGARRGDRNNSRER